MLGWVSLNLSYILIEMYFSKFILTGALVIPLDWDRWWQEWPIPSCFGALIGFLIGALISRKYKFSQKYSV